MLRDVFYYGKKPNAHPREKFAKSFEDARANSTTKDFWIINEFCDYRGFDWYFDFELLPDPDVWAEDHINVWPSHYQKDSGTWLCSTNPNALKIYRADVDPIPFKNEIHKNWKIIEEIEKDKFDFKWHPDPTDPPYIYVFGNQWHSGAIMPTVEYHVPGAINKKYITDKIAILAQSPRLFKILHDTVKFDFSWRPDPTSPPYIYVFGNSQYPGTIMPTIEYHVEGATKIKYVNDFAPDLIRRSHEFEILEDIDKNAFDFSWVPDPTSPPYIYVWGNQWNKPEDKVSVRYVVEGATEFKYMEQRAIRLPCMDNWRVPVHVSEGTFDYSWEPNPNDPPYVYQFGTQWQKTDGPQYYIEGATELKYVDTIKATVVCYQFLNWKIPMNIDRTKFDFSWHPDMTEDPYIYQFPSQWQRAGGPRFVVEGATDIKYVDTQTAIAKVDMTHWSLPEGCSTEDFDYSWHPDIEDEPMIYQFGTQHQKTGGPVFTAVECDENSPIKYIDTVKAKALPTTENWVTYEEVIDFDYSWHPDATEEPYIYQWGNKFYSSELKPTVEYIVPGATQIKHMSQDVKLAISDKWIEHYDIDKNKFDMSWRPDPTSPPYIYAWGNKHVPVELKATLEYVVEGATEYKYMPELIEVLPEFDRWREIQAIDKSTFDLTWRPDPREPDYIYVWGNKHIAGELKSTIEYHCPSATERKYMGEVEVLPEYDRWKISQEVENFDFTWRPDPREPAYIYTWGNKHIPAELKPTVEYYCEGATEHKYMGNVEVLPEFDKWNIVQKITDDVDLSWRPDPREPAYIYVWGNKWIQGELKPTLEYYCEGATERKYMGEVEVLPEFDKWKEIQPVDKNKFDMSWRPDPREPAYIYTWGNKYINAELKPTLEYHCLGATERKYMGEAEVLPEFDKWKEIQPIDRAKFDFTWRPDPREPAYIYTWGNKYINAELKPTLEYHCEGATERKYMGNIEVLPEFDKWNIVQEVENFDFTWRPDPREPDYIYVWGNKHISGELKPTIEYHCENATERKYVGNVDVAPEWNRYQILIPVDKTSFDFTWRPDPREPAFIYVWGNQSNNAIKEPTIEYHCPGATERKYMTDTVAKTLPIVENWKIWIPVDNFDFSWRPDPDSPPYIYVFGNQWHDAMTEPTLEYHCEGATEKKYVTDIIPNVAKTQENWKTLIPVDDFDYSWRPNPHSPPYIYVFGNQWHSSTIEPTIEYVVPGATDKKYVTDILGLVKFTATEKYWKRLIPIESFDYSWRPDPKSPPYIYVFGNKWNDATTEPSIEYHVEGATEYKYVKDIVATPRADLQYWHISNNDDLETFDFTWRPNPHSPPQIYQWADNGPRYTVPSATEVVLMEHTAELKRNNVVKRYKIKTTLEDLISEHQDEVFWAINPDLSYEKFDFSWRPNEENFLHINVFGNEYSMNTQTYYINGPMYMLGHRDVNYVEGQSVEIDSNLSMFFVDRGNTESTERYNELKLRYPQLQKTRYLNSWVDTINRCNTKSDTKLCWILNSELYYRDFDFNFYPSPWQMKMVHVFGTQWSNWGTTFLINTESFSEDTKYVKIIEHLNVLNFVKKKIAMATNCLYDIVLVDHGNKETTDINQLLKDKTGKIPTIIKFNKSYLQTFSNYLKDIVVKKEHYIWICSSICDYVNFDFTYICDPFAKEQLHVFPSDKQKFGDTFLVDVNKFISLLDDILRLEDYEKVNYNQHQRVKRLSAPVILVKEDTHVELNKYDFEFPYAEFVTPDNEGLLDSKIMYQNNDEPISVWAPNHRTIIIKSSGGTRITVPKDAKDYIDRELYDYPYITRSKTLWPSKPIDIIFLSNGEACADANYEHLLKATKGIHNRVIRIDGVNGRVKSQHNAAETATTPWYFLVNGKLKVNTNFDWSWQPDRLQVPKHYIFNATNPVNGLEYGHQAIVANNKKLTLETVGNGLDFTLDSEHEVVMVNCGVATYNTSAWDTWRTAFRETIKLKHSGTEENKERLDTWLNVAYGDFAEYSKKGANDAMKYYDSVNGDFDKLKLSYDWAWLRTVYDESVDL
jgi:hypothetical protein